MDGQTRISFKDAASLVKGFHAKENSSSQVRKELLVRQIAEKGGVASGRRGFKRLKHAELEVDLEVCAPPNGIGPYFLRNDRKPNSARPKPNRRADVGSGTTAKLPENDVV
jgi:hypothetical protein